MDIFNGILKKINVPKPGDKVYKDECILSFDNPDSPSGLYVNLTSFYGLSKNFVNLYYQMTDNPVFLHIKRERIQITNEACKENLEPERKITRLAIGVEGGFCANENKDYEYQEKYTVVLMPNFQTFSWPNLNFPEKLKLSVEAIINAPSITTLMEAESNFGTWDGEVRKVSKEAENLLQLNINKKIPPNGWKCEVCFMESNLWLNLTDGSILCGRKFYEGYGGNNHAVEHYEKTKYPLAVKLGTITQDAKADVFSYSEDDMVEDPKLVEHLAHWGINIDQMKKTDKSIIEMEIDLNKKTEWKGFFDTEKNVLVYGPGLTGMINQGNACYLNSVMQVLFSIPDFIFHYNLSPESIFNKLTDDPVNDFNVQMCKLANGLLSGRYSQPPSENNDNYTRQGITPSMFKYVVGKGHPEFSSKRQQDAQEFLLHVLNMIERNNVNNKNQNPEQCFKFNLEERLQCGSTNNVKYSYKSEYMLSLNVPLEDAVNKDEVREFEKRKQNNEFIPQNEIVRPKIPFSACLKLFENSEIINPFFSTAINCQTTAEKTTRLATFPDYLVIHVKKFTVLQDWSYIKLDVSIDMPDILDISHLRGKGLQPNEKLLPEIKDKVEVTVNPVMYKQLLDMGFSANVCHKALYYTQNNSLENATNWIMEHIADADFNDPFQLPGVNFKNTTKEFLPNYRALSQIREMGFSTEQAMKALKSNDNDLERAIDWVFSHPEELNSIDVKKQPEFRDGPGKYKLKAFITHLGTSTHVGHYVCHILKNDQWILYNDEKVQAVENVPKDLAYMFFYERLHE